MTALSGLAQVAVAALPRNETAPAFQPSAFQNDTFQVVAGTSSGTGVLADGAATVSGVGLATNFNYLRGYSGGGTGAPLNVVNAANIALNAGEFAVCLVALDNIGTTDGVCNEFNGGSVQNLAVQDSMGLVNPWLCAGEWRAGAGLGAGQVISVWYCNVHASMASSGSNFLTFTFNTKSGTVPASFAWTLGIFKPATGFFGLLEQYGSTAGTGASGNAPGGEGLVNSSTSTIGSLDFTTLNDMQLLRIRGVACGQGVATALTKTSTWDGTFPTGVGGPATSSGSAINAEYSLGQQGTTFPSAPSVAGAPSTFWASYYVAFRASNFIMSANTDAHINNSGNARWGTGTSTTASQTSVSASNSNNWKINVGDLAIAVIAQQGTATGDEGIVTSVTDSVGNTWTKAIEYSYFPTSWPNSACVSVWYCTVVNQITGSSTVTAHFTANSQHNASVIEVYGFLVAGGTAQLITTNKIGSNATTAGSLDGATSAISALRFRAFTSAEVGSVVAKTGNAWNSTLAASGTTGTNLQLMLRGEYGVSTGTGLASNPPASSACAKSSVYLVFQSGIAPAAGAGALSDSSSTVAGAGVTVSTGAGVLVDGASVVVGAGIVVASGTGALVDGPSAVVGFGGDVWTGTGALVDGAASAAGVGLSLSSGFGTLADAGSVIVGVGAITATEWTGTGALVDDAATVSGAAVVSWGAIGVLIDAAAVVAGVGNVTATEWTGTGVLIDGASVANGIGYVLSADAGGGALVDDAAFIVGSGQVIDIGAGALFDDASTIIGVGLGAITGVGTVAASPSTVVGVGSVAVLGIGVLVDGAVIIAGLGDTNDVGSGGLIDGNSSASGTGLVNVSNLQASGALVDSPVVIVSAGVVAWAGAGALVDASAVVTGAGNVLSSGVGALADSPAVVNGIGLLSVTGVGALIDDVATIHGTGEVWVVPPGGIMVDSFASATGSGITESDGFGTLGNSFAFVTATGLALPVLFGSGSMLDAPSAIAGSGLSESDGFGDLVDGASGVRGLDSIVEASASLVAGSSRVSGAGVTFTIGLGLLQAGKATVMGFGTPPVNPYYTVTQTPPRGFEVAGADRGFSVTEQNPRVFVVTDQRKR